MKFIGIILVEGVLFAALPQAKPLTTAPKASDTLQTLQALTGKAATPVNCCAMGCPANCCCNVCPMQGGFNHPWAGTMHNSMAPRFIIALALIKLMALGFLMFLALNILLAVLVSRDMKRRESFNGLWIALVLIAGIPCAVIYALFRLGDAVKEKKISVESPIME